jgi:hypothetical protein
MAVLRPSLILLAVLATRTWAQWPSQTSFPVVPSRDQTERQHMVVIANRPEAVPIILHVSPIGSGQGDGSTDHSFASLARAQRPAGTHRPEPHAMDNVATGLGIIPVGSMLNEATISTVALRETSGRLVRPGRPKHGGSSTGAERSRRLQCIHLLAPLRSPERMERSEGGRIGKCQCLFKHSLPINSAFTLSSLDL